MKTLITTLALLFLACVVCLATRSPCKPCKSENCASPSQCLAGYATDRCGCCQICARTENELCDTSPEEGRFGICGENLECKARRDFQDAEVGASPSGEPSGGGENVCVCRESKMVCSNEGTTYPTICALNEESISRGTPDKYNPELSMEYWGPCMEAPVIMSPPEDSYGPLGANLTLDCEARGFPAPTITWQFLSTEGKTISLPSDDQSVSIQMRGGPEPLMVTGWMQIMALDPSYIGVYHCIASNSEGQAFSRASVGVYKSEF